MFNLIEEIQKVLRINSDTKMMENDKNRGEIEKLINHENREFELLYFSHGNNWTSGEVSIAVYDELITEI